MIEVSNLFKSFNGAPMLKGVSFSVKPGEVVAIIGPSGSGKSTLLRCINGLETFDSGEIRVRDLALRTNGVQTNEYWNTVRQVRLRVGMVFQSFNLFPHLSVLENLILAPTKVAGKSREEAEVQARALLSRVNLQGKEAQFPPSLSGGEQQRVAIARALAMNPEAILFDEPTSNLDPELVGQVLSVINDLASEGYTMIIVTHQMRFARRCAGRIIFLDHGSILEEGPPEQIFDRPKTPRIRSFLDKLL
ncbi:MAG: amino acid ABC transporter ATP-binding protein [Acidobacteriota bacterium]